MLLHFVRRFFGETRRAPAAVLLPVHRAVGGDRLHALRICGGKGCRMCKGTGWIEIGGAGMVDPEVFAHVGYDSRASTPASRSAWASSAWRCSGTASTTSSSSSKETCASRGSSDDEQSVPMKISLELAARARSTAPLDGEDAGRALTVAGLEIEGRTTFAPILGRRRARGSSPSGRIPRPTSSRSSTSTWATASGDAGGVRRAERARAPAASCLWARPGATLPNGIDARREGGARHRVAGHAVRRGRARARRLARGHHCARRAPTAWRPGDDCRAQAGAARRDLRGQRHAQSPRWLGHVGVAREVAALLGLRR